MPKIRTLASEFPDWDDGDLPDLSPFAFVPWRNDVCPCYSLTLGTASVCLWVDYRAPELREFRHEPRMSLIVNDGSDDYPVAVSGETWDSLRDACNILHTGRVGFMPAPDMPLGQLLAVVAAVCL